MILRKIIRQTGSIPLNNEIIDFLLIKMPTRKQLTLRVTPTGEVEVRAPWRISMQRAEQFIHAHQEWLLAKRVSLLVDLQHRPKLEEGFSLPLLDTVLTLRILGEEATRMRRVGDELHLPLPLTPGSMESMLERWYRNQARTYLTTRLQVRAQEMGVSLQKLTIRGQKKRWGSCSTTGNINLNWQLMLLPSKVVEYVIVHELCHRWHMNHSTEFWSKVMAILPDYQQLQQQLKTIKTPWQMN